MDFNDYREVTQRTKGHLSDRDALINWSMGISGESGEVLDHVKKYLFHNHLLDVEKIKLELGDVLYYTDQLAALLGFTLEEIAIANDEKLKKRYPEGFDPERSRNREEL